MQTNLMGEFYNAVVTEISIPDEVDVSVTDFVASKYNQIGLKDGLEAVQRPFLICHPVALTLRVETWLGKEVTWQFPAGGYPYPMPLRKILKHPDNSTSNIKIGY